MSRSSDRRKGLCICLVSVLRVRSSSLKLFPIGFASDNFLSWHLTFLETLSSCRLPGLVAGMLWRHDEHEHACEKVKGKKYGIFWIRMPTTSLLSIKGKLVIPVTMFFFLFSKHVRRRNLGCQLSVRGRIRVFLVRCRVHVPKCALDYQSGERKDYFW